ncbi:MAG: hypothetical protein Q4C42_03510 [Clostridia bacterium]|nr:hypothetical protein [Clostridia bacterium]
MKDNIILKFDENRLPDIVEKKWKQAEDRISHEDMPRKSPVIVSAMKGAGAIAACALLVFGIYAVIHFEKPAPEPVFKPLAQTENKENPESNKSEKVEVEISESGEAEEQVATEANTELENLKPLIKPEDEFTFGETASSDAYCEEGCLDITYSNVRAYDSFADSGISRFMYPDEYYGYGDEATENENTYFCLVDVTLKASDDAKSDKSFIKDNWYSMGTYFYPFPTNLKNYAYDEVYDPMKLVYFSGAGREGLDLKSSYFEFRLDPGEEKTFTLGFYAYKKMIEEDNLSLAFYAYFDVNEKSTESQMKYCHVPKESIVIEKAVNKLNSEERYNQAKDMTDRFLGITFGGYSESERFMNAVSEYTVNDEAKQENTADLKEAVAELYDGVVTRDYLYEITTDYLTNLEKYPDSRPVNFIYDISNNNKDVSVKYELLSFEETEEENVYRFELQLEYTGIYDETPIITLNNGVCKINLGLINSVYFDNDYEAQNNPKEISEMISPENEFTFGETVESTAYCMDGNLNVIYSDFRVFRSHTEAGISDEDMLLSEIKSADYAVSEALVFCMLDVKFTASDNLAGNGSCIYNMENFVIPFAGDGKGDVSFESMPGKLAYCSGPSEDYLDNDNRFLLFHMNPKEEKSFKVGFYVPKKAAENNISLGLETWEDNTGNKAFLRYCSVPKVKIP